MKMVKAVLLAGAAGIAAASGAQAADLPVKAKAVEYVKVCSAYGAGFFYIPGTDTCIKIGGYIYMDYDFNSAGNHGPYWSGAVARDNRHETPSYNTRVRTEVSFDTRTQTEYGTLRSYIRGGWELNSNTSAYTGTAFVNDGGTFRGASSTTEAAYRGPTQFSRAFIQFAGLTIGKTQSFFDFYAGALGYTTPLYAGSATGAGINLIAYTAQFGGGFSATISLEENNHRKTYLAYANSALSPLSTAGAQPPNYGFYRAPQYPDVVANLRLDQPWGSAQIMGAIHDASGGCGGAAGVTAGNMDCSIAQLGSKTGYAIGGGVKFNLPFAAGDELWLQGTYANGATSYLGPFKFGATDAFGLVRNPTTAGRTLTTGFAGDGVADAAGTIHTVRGYQFTVAAQHFWTPALRTSVFGGYMNLQFSNAGATAICAAYGAAARPATCNPDWSMWQVGTRTIWSPVANLDIGLEVLYSKINQNHVGNWTIAQAGAIPGGAYRASDNDFWTGSLRFTRNFWP